MTIHELNLMILDYEQRIKGERKAGIISAFYSAYFSKHEKLCGSDLQRVLDGIDKESKKQNLAMTDEQMLSVVKRLAGV